MKNAPKRLVADIVCLVLAAVMCLTAAGCSKTDPTIEQREQLIDELYGAVELAGAADTTGGDATTSSFTLSYSREDVINPYLCKSTLNATLSDLLYDQLITVNSEFEAEMVIALKVEYTGTRSMTVTLRDGIVFSDGTPLTAADIKYSFDAACASKSRFKGQLALFQSCSGSENMVYFRLNEADPRAHMLLDFPIIKKESDKDNAPPIGSGKYVYISDVEHGTYLARNERWFRSNESKAARISLVSMPTVESIVHSVEIGTISYYYTDLRDGFPGRINANYATVDINNLVYMGVNTANPILQLTPVRAAISMQMDREEIITAAYAGRAYAATGPLTTSWPEAAMAQSGSTLATPMLALSTLKDAGFISEDEDRRYHRYDAQGNYLEFTLLVNEDNEQQLSVAERIATQLEDAGIGITIHPVSFEELLRRIAAGDYQLYLGEYALYNNMDFSELFTPNKGLYYGLMPANTIEKWQSYLSGEVGIDKVIEAFEAERPFIPVCYRLGMVCYSRSLTSSMNISESDLFWGMELWDIALAG